MKKECFVFILFIMISGRSFSQEDSSEVLLEKLTRFTMGIGYDLNPPSYGINLTAYYRFYNFAFTYYMPRSSTDKFVQDIKNGYIIRGGISPLSFYNFKNIFPIYLGFGYSFINEKNKVLNYSGSGIITGFHFYSGLQTLPDHQGFWGSFGVHLELGYSSWNYDESLLKKNNSDKEYNFSKFFFSFGLAFYFI